MNERINNEVGLRRRIQIILMSHDDRDKHIYSCMPSAIRTENSKNRVEEVEGSVRTFFSFTLYPLPFDFACKIEKGKDLG